MADLIGRELGRYHILERLGEGGMAVVYKAYDTRLETDVAVKVIRTERLAPEIMERALKRFEREAKALAKLTHPNIVKVTDYGEYEGRPYLVMPYLSGGTLKERLGRPMGWQEAVKLLLPVARALDYAHRQGMIHRDVKPSNILITSDGDPMLTDFGIAKIIAEEGTVDLTGTSTMVGTPEYMAPEQATARAVDARVDIYSLGIVLYETVTGRKPFTADTPMAVIIKQAHDPLPRPRSFVPSLAQEVENLLLKALAKRPEDRYKDMRWMAEALEGLLSRKVKAKPAGMRNGQQEIKAHKQGDSLATMQAFEPARKQPLGSPKSRLSMPILVGAGAAGILIVAGLLTFGTSLFSSGGHTIISASTPNATSAQTTTPTPALDIGFIWVRPADGMTMVYVPEGPFSMGSEDGADDEKPMHTVTLDAFWIDKTEVANAMYAKCVQDGACSEPSRSGSYSRSSYYGDSEFNNYPVINVTWEDARDYCGWAGGRLPTEAEWEKAARGTDGRTYPWGEGIDCSMANYWGKDGLCTGDTTAVGSYPQGASPYGALDMTGNVMEWVADWYGIDYYVASPQRDPAGASSGEERVLRGSSWRNHGNNVRASYRRRSNPSSGDLDYGFRCAR